MTFTPGMPDSAGDFTPPKAEPLIECRHCKQTGHVSRRTWDSSCGGWTDYRYDCSACGKGWWVEGIDS